MPKGGVGRKRNMGDLSAFLNWGVLEKKYLGIEWLPLTSKQYAKYIWSVPKGKKKKTTREHYYCYFKGYSNFPPWKVDKLTNNNK